MLCYVMLCYVMLCYVMLCYVMLCYVMLCYVMLAGLLLYELHCTLMELRHRRRDDVLDAIVQVRQAS